MIPIHKLSIVLLPFLLLTACATSDYDGYHEGSMYYPAGQKLLVPDITHEKGRVWFYRIAPRTTPGFWRTITLNNKVVAEANPYRVYMVDVNPGTYEVAIGDEKVMVTVEKQQQVFIKTVVSIGTWSDRIYPTEVDPEIGIPEIGIYESGIGGKKIPDDLEK